MPGSVENTPAPAERTLVDAQLSANILLGIIGLMSAVAGIAAVGAIWSLGRQAYRKN